MNLADRAVRKQILALPVSRIVVTSFASGETLFPTPPSPFRQMPLYVGRPDPLALLLKEAHAGHVAVYAQFDLFFWHAPGGAFDPFAWRPDWKELTGPQNCSGPAEGDFASPFNLHVQTAVSALLTQAARRYHGLDGLLLNACLSNRTVLGYSDAAREAYIIEAGVDPIDIVFEDAQPNHDLAMDWFAWRQRGLTHYLASVRKALRAAAPSIRIAVTGSLYWNRLSTGQRTVSLGDWPNWVRSSIAEEVVISSAYPPQNDARAPGSQRASVASEPGIKSMLVPLSNGGKEADPLAAIEELQGIGARDAMFEMESISDLRRVKSFFTAQWPALAPVLEGLTGH